MALPDRKAQPPDRKALAKAIEDLLLASGAELDAETREPLWLIVRLAGG